MTFMETVEIINVFDLIFFPWHVIMCISFGWITSFLRMLGTTTFIMGIGKILDLWSIKSKIGALKIFLYLWSICYSIYQFELFQQIADIDALAITTSVLSIFGAIALMFMGRWLATRRIKGWRIFNYYTVMLAFIVIGYIWWVIYPEDVIFDFFVLYTIGSMLLVGLIRTIIKNSRG